MCESGTFRPDESKYYTLKVPGKNKFWKQEAISSTTQNTGNVIIGQPLKLTSDKLDASAHFRFIEKEPNKWAMVSRATGIPVDRNDQFKKLMSKEDFSDPDLLFRGSCSSNDKEKAILHLASDNSQKVHCERTDCREGSHISLMSFARKTKKTPCKYPSFLDSCNSYFKVSVFAPWEQVQYGKCGWANGKRFRRCETLDETKPIDFSAKNWQIQEVKEFKRPDVDVPPTISVLEGTLEGTESTLVGAAFNAPLAFANNIVTGSTVVVGGFGAGVFLSSILVDVLFPGPDLDSSLRQLAEEIVATIDNKIEGSQVKRDMENSANLMEVARKQYIVDYQGEKKLALTTLDPNDLQDLSQSLDEIFGKEYEDALLPLFAGPNDFTPTDLNLLRAQNVWSMMKLGMVETLMLYQEAVAVDAFRSAELGLGLRCKEDIYDAGLALNSIVRSFSQRLEATRGMLVQHRMADKHFEFKLVRKQCGTRPCPPGSENRAGVHDLLREETYWVLGRRLDGHADFNAHDEVLANVDEVMSGFRRELEFDMLNLSYRMKEEREFFDTFEEHTLLLCETMQSDAALREEFKSSVVEGFT